MKLRIAYSCWGSTWAYFSSAGACERVIAVVKDQDDKRKAEQANKDPLYNVPISLLDDNEPATSLAHLAFNYHPGSRKFRQSKVPNKIVKLLWVEHCSGLSSKHEIWL